MKFSEWVLMRENDDLELDSIAADMDMDMDMDVPSAPQTQAPRPPAARPQIQAPRPQVSREAPSAPKNVPSGEVKFGGGNYKFVQGNYHLLDGKKKIYKISAHYLVPSGDKVFSGLVGLKDRPVKVRLSLDDKNVSYDGGLDSFLLGGVKGFMKSFKTVPKFGDLDGKLSVFPVENGMSVNLSIFVDEGNKDLMPRIRLLKNYFETMGQAKKNWENVVVTVKMY